jgi:uncharacterized protein (DUF1501 family)
MVSRREFLRGSSLIALAPTIPGFLARTARAAGPESGGRVLVVVQLDGGNDGVNTVVPYRDEGYAKHRKTLRLPVERLITVNDQVGLHPALRDAGKLLDSGRLAIVPGVGYPNPSRSHFESMAVWQSARLDPDEHGGPGWLGRAFDSSAGSADQREPSLFVGSGPPPAALRGRRAVASALERLDDFALDPALVRSAAGEDQPACGSTPGEDLLAFVRRSTLDAYQAAARLADLTRRRDAGPPYPATGLAERLRTIALLMKEGHDARVFYTSQTGYDTHSAQLPSHAALLSELGGALRAFLDDLAAARLDQRVVVLCFSEFGRRVAENDSAGTDHGTAAPVLLAGPGVRAGLAGPYPSLTDLEDGDLKMAVDFRRIYAAILERWLGLPSREAIGGAFEPLPLFRDRV